VVSKRHLSQYCLHEGEAQTLARNSFHHSNNCSSKRIAAKQKKAFKHHWA